MTVKRYSIDYDAKDRLSVKQTSVGDFVSYADYEALKAKIDMIHGLMEATEQANALVRECVENMAKERDAVVAENAALKSAHPQPFGREMMRALDAYEKHQDEVPETGMLNAFFILRDSINLKTPATAAVLADIEARGVEKLLTSDPAELIAAMPAYRQMTVSEDNVRDVLNAVRATLELRKGAAV